MDQLLLDIMSEAFPTTSVPYSNGISRAVSAKNSIGELVEATITKTSLGTTIRAKCGDRDTYQSFEFVGIEHNDARSVAQAINLLFN